MGAVSFSIDPRVLDVLATNLKLDLFVETGTFEGDSIACAKKYFNELYSVELSPEYSDVATNKFLPFKNINIIHGDGSAVIKQLQPTFSSRSAVFWLDAHWCVATNTAGEHSQCHLAEEIDAIGELNDDSVVLIDDARFFLAPPPYPHVFLQWPNFSTILKKLQALSDRHEFRVINDVILFFPRKLSAAIDEYGYQHGVDWNHIYQKAAALDDREKICVERLEVINVLNSRVIELEGQQTASLQLLSQILRTKQLFKNIYIRVRNALAFGRNSQ